jgi:hypothetical protein
MFVLVVLLFFNYTENRNCPQKVSTHNTTPFRNRKKFLAHQQKSYPLGSLIDSITSLNPFLTSSSLISVLAAIVLEYPARQAVIISIKICRSTRNLRETTTH